MIDKERIEQLEARLRIVEQTMRLWTPRELNIEPKHPEPGTVVEWRLSPDRPWKTGLVGEDEWLLTTEGQFFIGSGDIEYRPVEILREGEYKVTPPPSTTYTWQGRVWDVFEHSAGLMAQVLNSYVSFDWGRHIATVTREDMERREAGE